MQIIVRPFHQAPRLELWEATSFWPNADRGPGPGDRNDAYEREVAAEAPGPPEPGGPHRGLASAIFAYRIFPARLVTPVLRREPLGPGDTVGIQYHVAPGLDLFFAARVVRCQDELQGGTWKTGFTYRTLRGHPELGEETFSVEKDVATGKVSVALRSWSRPGTLLAKVLAPILRVLQVRASRAAVEELAGLVREGFYNPVT